VSERDGVCVRERERERERASERERERKKEYLFQLVLYHVGFSLRSICFVLQQCIIL
jgi:hypothetical protein